MMDNISQQIVEILIETILISGVIDYFITKREERIKKTIEEEFKKRDTFFNAQFNFKQRALEELLGPMMMQFKRSSIALNAYKPNNSYREDILKQCNIIIRTLLLEKGFLIPSVLLPDAAELIKHYDRWLEHYNNLRGQQNNTEEAYVFTFDFPKQAEKNFLACYEEYRKEIKVEEKLK